MRAASSSPGRLDHGELGRAAARAAEAVVSRACSRRRSGWSRPRRPRAARCRSAPGTPAWPRSRRPRGEAPAPGARAADLRARNARGRGHRRRDRSAGWSSTSGRARSASRGPPGAHGGRRSAGNRSRENVVNAAIGPRPRSWSPCPARCRSRRASNLGAASPGAPVSRSLSAPSAAGVGYDRPGDALHQVSSVPVGTDAGAGCRLV